MIQMNTENDHNNKFNKMPRWADTVNNQFPTHNLVAYKRVFVYFCLQKISKEDFFWRIGAILTLTYQVFCEDTKQELLQSIYRIYTVEFLVLLHLVYKNAKFSSFI